MVEKVAFVVLGIAVAIVGFITPFEQGLNNCFYPIVGLVLVAYGLSRGGRGR